MSSEAVRPGFGGAGSAVLDRRGRLGLLVAIGVLAGGVASAQTSPASPAVADAATVTILSSNLADGSTIGEWGLSALVEVDGRCVLFDTGRNPDTVINNARALGVELGCVTDVVLSHFHFDHTTGLLPLVLELRTRRPAAVRVHVAEGFFRPRRRPSATGDEQTNQMIDLRDSLEAAGVEFVEHTGPAEIAPSVWVTGPVDRRHPERNYSAGTRVFMAGEWVEDNVPDSQGLTVLTPSGHVVLLGCAR